MKDFSNFDLWWLGLCILMSVAFGNCNQASQQREQLSTQQAILQELQTLNTSLCEEPLVE